MNADLSHSKATRTNRWAAFRSEVYPATMTFDMSAGNTPVADHQLRSRRPERSSPLRAG